MSIAAGAGVAAAFFGVRIWQQATARVLAVEFFVAAVILAGVVLVRARVPRRPGGGGRVGVPLADAAFVTVAALAEYAGLVL